VFQQLKSGYLHLLPSQQRDASLMEKIAELNKRIIEVFF
jgi:hypothetical protein